MACSLVLMHRVTEYRQCSALDKPFGELGIYATWLSSIAYMQKQLCIFIFFKPHFFFL